MPYVVNEGRGLGVLTLAFQGRLALGIRNLIFLVKKEPEVVREVERYAQDIVVLISTHGMGSKTNLLEKDWTLFHSGVDHGERHRAGGGSY